MNEITIRPFVASVHDIFDSKIGSPMKVEKFNSQNIGATFDVVDSSIIDEVGELVKMVAGSAKGWVNGHSISVSLPTVVLGDLCRRTNMPETMWTELGLESEMGTFWLIISLTAVQTRQQEVVREGTRR